MDYRPELDGLRAVAVAVVVLFHSDLTGPFAGGFVGVDLFFVLSGFLITSILAGEVERTGHIRLGHFYGRRLLRLMPALLLFLAIYIAVAPFVWPLHDHAFDAMLSALYLSDYSFALWRLPKYISHTWSLAVEEHYYLLWPLILPAVVRSKRPLVWLGLAWLIVTVWRTANYDSLMAAYRFDTRASGLILGGMLYFMRGQVSHAMAWAGLFLFGAVVISASMPITIIAVPVAEVASALLVAGAGNLSFLRNPALVGLGKLSYGVYLWHFPIASIAREHMPFALTVAVVGSASVVCAALSYWTAESIYRKRR